LEKLNLPFSQAVMLTCVIDAQENRDFFAVVDIPNAFVQMIVSDKDANL
jgi:hypothetical protein